MLLCIIGVGSPPHTALMQWLVHDPDLRQPSIVHNTPNSNYGQYTILLHERSSFISGGCRGGGRAEEKQWQHNIVHNESTPAYGCAFAWLSSYFVPVILYLFHHPSIIMSSNFLNFAHQFLDYILSLALLLLRRRLLGCGCGCWFCVSRDQRNNTRNSLLLHPRALRSILCQIRLSAPLCCHHGSILPYYRPHTTPWSAYRSFLWAESGYGTTGAGCGID